MSLATERSGDPATLYEVYLSLRAVQIVFYRKGVVALETIKGIKNACVFDAFDLESLCFIMIAGDHDKTEVKTTACFISSVASLRLPWTTGKPYLERAA